MFLFPFDMLSFMVVSVSLFFVLVCHSHHSYTPYPPPPPKFCISIAFNFSLQTKVMENFGVQTGCIMGDVQMVNIMNRYQGDGKIAG